ncbi:hypothetical protein O181_029538 [Austropuccinia psidii MF-1]|uniref:Uncharacterized protein n=1 Tax=Austropuccinia psidii MF-1 TaxID=1389203 RepID=A0A9Q3CVW8_9BASI|nr:hypothetical protein [Austropuccinia psidii MF-1]
MKNCGANEFGMESGDFPQTRNGNDDKISHTGIQVQTEEIGNKNGLLPSDCGESLRRDPIDDLNQEAGNNSMHQGGACISTNCLTPLELIRPILQHEHQNHILKSKFHEKHEYKHAKSNLTLNAHAPAEPRSHAKVTRQ